MTRCILAVTFAAASLLSRPVLAWEALDNFVDDLVSCCTIDCGPPVDYGPPPAVYSPPSAPPPPPVPVMVIPEECPPQPVFVPPPAPQALPAAPCCEPCDCCGKLRECWQRCCNWWSSLCSKCCPGLTAGPGPQYQPQFQQQYQTPYLGGPTGTDYTYPDGEMYSGGEQSYEVTYPPSNGYETYMEGPSFEVDPTSQYSPGYEYSPSYPSYEYGRADWDD